ncbi:MAG: hypothetical protein JXR97_10865, partial [Planctomycetes bacterium]|nr:hypothetical protein [Planctomycetota bacterium]
MSRKPYPAFPVAESLLAALGGGDAVLHGVWGGALGKTLADMEGRLARPLLVVASEPEEAEDIAADMAVFGMSGNVQVFPAWDILPS